MAFALVQQAISAAGGIAGTAISQAFTNTVGVGNLVYGFIQWDFGGSLNITSVTDDKGNTYTIADNVNNATDNQRMAAFYKENLTNAPKTISGNFASSASFARIEICEISGAATASAIDGHTAQAEAASTSHSSGNITTTQNGDWIAGGAMSSNTGSTITAGSGFTIDNSGGGAVTLPMASEHQTQTTAGTIAGTFTFGTSARAVTAVMAFKASSSSQTLTPPLYSDAEAFFSATFTKGAVNLAPPLYADAETFFSATFTKGAVNLAPPLYADAESFFAATFTRGAVNLAPPLFSDTDSFFAATFAPGAVNLTAPLFSDTDTFFAPAASQSGVFLTYTDFRYIAPGATATITYNVGGDPSIGAADPLRIVAIATGGRMGSTLPPSAVTIAGITATMAPGAFVESGGAMQGSVWYAPVPTGTTATVVVTWPVVPGGTQIFVYRIITHGPNPTTAATAAGPANAEAAPISYTVPTAGASLAAYFQRDSAGSDGAVTWTNATADLNIVNPDGRDVSAAHTTATGAVTVTAADPTGVAAGIASQGAESALVAVAWGDVAIFAPPLLSDAEAFFSAVFAPGAVNLAAPLFSDAESILLGYGGAGSRQSYARAVLGYGQLLLGNRFAWGG